MAQAQAPKTQSQKIEDARDLQQTLYREIGISAVAAALRFTNQPDSIVPVQASASRPGAHRGDNLAA